MRAASSTLIGVSTKHPDDAPGHAFISYVREDAERVDRLQQILESAGIQGMAGHGGSVAGPGLEDRDPPRHHGRQSRVHRVLFREQREQEPLISERGADSRS